MRVGVSGASAEREKIPKCFKFPSPVMHLLHWYNSKVVIRTARYISLILIGNMSYNPCLKANDPFPNEITYLPAYLRWQPCLLVVWRKRETWEDAEFAYLPYACWRDRSSLRW